MMKPGVRKERWVHGAHCITVPISPLSDCLEFLTLCLPTVHHVGQLQLQQSTVHLVAGLYGFRHIHDITCA